MSNFLLIKFGKSRKFLNNNSSIYVSNTSRLQKVNKKVGKIWKNKKASCKSSDFICKRMFLWRNYVVQAFLQTGKDKINKRLT